MQTMGTGWCRRPLALMPLCLLLCFTGFSATVASSSMDDDDAQEQRRVRTCLSDLFSCYPSDVSDPSPVTCSESSNFTCSAQCPSYGQSFFESLQSSKSDQLSQTCDAKYCYHGLDNCLGQVVHEAYSSGDWTSACSAWNQQASCISDVQATCHDETVFAKFYHLFSYGCANANSKSYMASFAKCFPYSFFDLTAVPQKTDICRNASDVSTCVQNIARPDDLSFDVKNFTVSLRDDFIFGCSPDAVCQSVLSGCLASYISTPLPPSLLQQLICSNIQDLDKCVKNSEYGCSYPDDIDAYLRDSCYGLVCEAGLESCYSQFEQPLDYTSDVTTVITNFCSVTNNITTCLDSYQDACTASGNADASLRNNLISLCSGNDVAAPGECYFTALKCFYQYFPTLTKPSALWTTNTDTNFCSNYDAIASCLDDASATCPTNAGSYSSAIANLKEVIGIQCSAPCSSVKIMECQDAMTYYLTQIWTNATSESSLCSILSQQLSCYSTMIKRCAVSSNPSLSIAVLNSIQVAIEQGSCNNFTTIPATPPAGCDVTTAVSYVTSFLNATSQLVDLSANNYSALCELWARTKASLLSIAASCSGGVGDRIIAAVASVDVVITSLCSGQCQLEQASQYIKELNIQVQAALQFQVPVDYLGRPKKLFCRRGQGDDDEDCYDYKFYWGTICVDINSTLKYVAQYTSGCSDSIKKTQLDSVTVTADIYYQQCQTEEYTCDVDVGTQCLTNFSSLAIYYPLLSDSDKKVACSLESTYSSCFWNSFVQCSPFFYLHSWAIQQAWYWELKCTPPTIFDNVNTNKTLNITVIEKLCGADIIYLYIQQLIKALVSQALNTTGNADDLSTVWQQVSAEITSVIASNSASGQCAAFVNKTTDVNKTIDDSVSKVNDTTPVCHLDDAYACIKSLQDFVNLKSLKKLPCGCIANSTNDTKTEFCRRVIKAKDCVTAATAGCDDDDVIDAFAALNQVQFSTGLKCLNPCDSGPCQHGSVCTNNADGKTYQCQCAVGYSGPNCDQIDCNKKTVFACFETILQSLFAGNYSAYCASIEAAKTCVSQYTASCPSVWYDVPNQILVQLTTALQIHCDSAAPTPSPEDCDGGSVTCLSQVYSSNVKFWDTGYGGLVDAACSKWVNVQLCVSLATPACGGVSLALEGVFSLLCTNISSTCQMQTLIDNTNDLTYAAWHANTKQPRKVKDNKSPDDELKHLTPCQRNKKKAKTANDKNQRHKRLENEKRGNNGGGGDDELQENDDDVCWYLQQKLNLTLKTASNCSDSVRSSINTFIANLKLQYLNDSQCSSPCDDNQCSNLGTCVPDGYGYKCLCLHGYTGTFCEKNDTTVVVKCDSSVSVECLTSVQSHMYTIINGPYSETECSTLVTKYDCLSTSYLPCDDDAYTANFQVISYVYNKIITSCTTQTPVVKTCELEAAYSCVATLVESVVAQSGTFCSLLQAAYQCASSISVVCSNTSSADSGDFVELFVEQTFSSYSLACSTPDCSIVTAKACLQVLYDKVTYNKGDGSVCDIAASTTLCLAVSLSNCDSYVSGKVYALYYSYISVVTLECTDACATQPCANGGTCTRTNTKDGFKCACAAGYGGKRCDTPTNCDSYSIEVCLESAAAVLSSVFDPCHTTDCSVIAQLTVCLNTYSSGCANIKKSLISAAASSLLQLKTICTSKTVDCAEPPTCLVPNITDVGSKYTLEALLKITSDIGPSFDDICGSYNATYSLLAELTVSATSCSSSYVAYINVLINWMRNISGKDCSTPTTCQAPQAQSCIDDYNTKVAEVKKRVYCPIAQKKEIETLDKEKEKCVADNTKKCSDDEKKPIDENNNKSRNNDTDIITRPCLNSRVCKANATCQPLNSGKFKCKCPPGQVGKQCDEKPICNLNAAIDCVDAFQQYVELKGCIGKKLSQAETDDFCKKAKSARDCAVAASVNCSSDLSQSVFRTLYSVQAAVGYSCFSYCSSKPCKNNGVCKETKTPASYPAKVVPPPPGYSCQCQPGYSGPNCESANFSVSAINKCYVDILNAIIRGETQGICDGSLIAAMATCISEAVTTCPIGRRQIALKISILLQSVFQGTFCPVGSGSCSSSSLVSSCFADLTRLTVPLWNNVTQEADDNYCRKLTLVQSCSVAGCDTVVTVVQELFAVICVNLPSPIQNVTKWLDIIEIILNHLNKTNPEPPPDDTTSPRPETPRRICIRSITSSVLYIDGEHYFDLPDNGEPIGDISLDDNIQIIAVQASSNLGIVAGIVVSTSDGSIVTDITWKCTSVVEIGWTAIDYNDAAWPYAVPVDEADLKMYGEDKKCSSRAKYIWTAKRAGSYDQTVYCRAFFGQRRIRAAGSCFFEFFIDGVLQEDITNNNQSGVVGKGVIPSGSHVVGVHSSCSSDTSRFGFIVEISAGLLVTDGIWKCSGTYTSGWYIASFDVSAWLSAVIVSPNNGKIFQLVAGISAQSNWIWAAGSNVYEVYCRTSVTIPPNTNVTVTPPPPPTPDASTDDDFCWNIQKGIDEVNDELDEVPDNLKDAVQESIIYLVGNYSANESCKHPCDTNKCQNSAKCTPKGLGYDCQCLPGYSGPHCETGGVCNIPQATGCLKKLNKFITSVLNGGDWRPNVCSTFRAVYQCISVSLYSCSDTSQISFELINVFLEYIDKSCNDTTTQNPPPVPCEATLLLKCGLKMVNELYVTPTGDLCGTLYSAYDCVAAVGASCGSSSSAAAEIRWYVWGVLEIHCRPPTCSVSNSLQCIYPLLNSYDKSRPVNNETCSLASSAQTCVASSTTGCDSFIHNKCKKKLESALEQVNVSQQCDVNVCSVSRCQNYGVCHASPTGSYTCECESPSTGDHCDESTTCYLSEIREVLEYSKSYIVSDLLDPCAPLTCSLQSWLTSNVTSHFSSCNGTVQSSITDLVNAISTLTCDDSQDCVTPLPSCELQTATQCASSFIEVLFTEYTNNGGPNYQAVCRALNVTKSCFASLTCTQEPFKTNIVQTLFWFNSIVSSKCSQPICLPAVAQSCLGVLNSTIESLMDSITRKISPVMSSDDLNKFCGSIQASIECVEGNLVDCSSGTEVDSIRQQLTVAISLVSGVCPLPCVNEPCVPDGTCVQTNSDQYECQCAGDVTKEGCTKVPSCDTNSAYACIAKVRNYLFWNGVVNPTPAYLENLPASFFDNFCSLVVEAQTCLSTYIETCDDTTRQRVYATYFELQTYVNTTCVKACSSSPCQNDGVCSDTSDAGASYNCSCLAGYAGPSCEQDLCSLNNISFSFWYSLKLLLTSFPDFCSSVSSIQTQITGEMVNCSSSIQNITNTVQQDYTSALSPFCPSGQPTPDCNFTSLNVQCLYSFQSLLYYFDNPSDQQANLLCNAWWQSEACVTTFEGTNQCVVVIGALQEVFGYLCFNPKSRDSNTTCDLHETVTTVEDLEHKCSKAHQKRPPTKKPSPPPSVGRCKKNELPPCSRNPPPEPEDVCREIQEDLDDLRHSVSDCRPTISDSVEKTIQNLTTQYLGEGQCDNPCEPNPCAYLGTCSKEGDYGYTCKCLPGYTGRNCETGAACDESSAYRDCLSDVDLYIKDPASWPTLCRKVDVVFSCLSQKMLGCTSVYDQVVFQLLLGFVQTLSTICTSDNITTIGSCEIQEVYKTHQYLVTSVSTAITLTDPRPTVCSILTEYQIRVKNVTIICSGQITSLTETLQMQIYGAQDVICQNPNCSISKANECIMQLYQLVSQNAQDNSTCESVWEQKFCVEQSTSACDDVLKQETQAAVNDIMAGSNVTCGSPCDTEPCRNGGTCSESGLDSYECACEFNYTGKYCEIETGCNLVGVDSCLSNVTEVIADLLLDPCHDIPVNCSQLTTFTECVTGYTSDCPSDTSERLDTVEAPIANISSLCSVTRTSPPDCDVPHDDCSVSYIKSCTVSYLETVFKEYSASGSPDYYLICSTLNLTASCFEQYSKGCTSDYLTTLNSSYWWLRSLTGSSCDQPICLPQQASSVLTYIKQEVEIYSARPGPVPDEDHTDFCFNMKESVSRVSGNTHQCDNGSQPEIDEELEAVKTNISVFCPYPCSSNPCLNGGVCTEVSWQDYSCECEEGFSGKSCQQVSLYPYTNHTQLNCLNRDRSIITQQIRLDVPFQIFCQKYSSLFLTEDGYVSFSDGALIVNYAKFCQNKHTILAPLFAGQDCSCPNSAVYYHQYFVSGTDADQAQRLDRATKDVKRCTCSSSAPDFTPTSVFVVTWENMMPFPCNIFQGVYGVTQGSTYQLVIISDLTRTFGQFIYSNVNAKYQVPFVYSGFTDQQGRCINSVQSGTSAMDHFENVPSSSSGDNSWIYPLFDSCTSSQPKPEDSCLSWVASAVDLSVYDLDACPCSGRLAAADPRYHFEYIDWFRYCYATNRVQVINTASGTQTAQVKQVCCFDPFNNGTLLTSPPYAGFPVVLDADSAKGNDSQAHLWCCTQSNKYCGLFLSLRPIGFCNDYTGPIEALLWGDPHFISADNFNYTFNPIGEFTLLKTTDGSFHFQTRTSAYIDSSGKTFQAAVFTSLAAQQAGEVKVEVSLNAARTGLVLYIDGVETSQNSVQTYYRNVYVSWSNNAINVTFPSGWTMTTSLTYRSLSFIHTVPNSYWNKTSGLLGNFNGDPSDDLTTPTGQVIPTTSTTQDIHYQFGLKWQITPAESLFTYPQGKTTADYTNASFVPYFEPPCNTDADIRAGLDLCGSNKFCYYDYCVTKDTALALNTKKTVADYSNNLMILSNLAPQLTINGLTPNSAGQYVINAMLNTALTFTLKATSMQNVAISYYMVGNISRESSAKLNISTGVFTWTPSSLNVVDVSFIALDSNGGVSAKLQVVVSMCDGCNGHGSCIYSSYTLLGNGTNYRLADCGCTIGWTGARCALDFDGCASQPCGSNNTAACIDLTPDQQQRTKISFSCSSCPPGYGSSQCIDIDECTIGTSQCDQICNNTIGSYQCSCRQGYRLSTSFTCTDIDECKEGTSSCPQLCTNTVGSFACSCYPGFQGQSCDPVVPCGANSCDYKCSLVNNQPTCVCQNGYMLNSSNGRTCTDINECSSDTTNFCSNKQMCVNTPGGYSCGCPDGLQVGPDRRTCQVCPVGTWGPSCSNICNCGMNVRQCDQVTGCTVCQSGWKGPLCTEDVNECAEGSVTCPADADCLNVPGTYYCICHDPTQTNPDNTCGNNKLRYKLRLKMTWVAEYSDLTNPETMSFKSLLEIQLTKIFSRAQNFVTVVIYQFFQSSVGVGFEVDFNTALSPERKAAIGQMLIQYLIDNDWTIPILSLQPQVISVPVLDFGNSTDNVLAGNPCMNNQQCLNGGTCTSQGTNLPTCSCTSEYTGQDCETKLTSLSTTPSLSNAPGSSTSALTIGLAVGLTLGLLLIAVIVVAVICFVRRGSRNVKSGYYNSEMVGFDDASLHRYEHQPVRYHPRWPFSSGTGYDQTDS